MSPKDRQWHTAKQYILFTVTAKRGLGINSSNLAVQLTMSTSELCGRRTIPSLFLVSIIAVIDRQSKGVLKKFKLLQVVS